MVLYATQTVTHSSGYGGSGKLRLSHSYAASVTCAMWGPKYNRKVWRPVPKPTDDKIPENKFKISQIIKDIKVHLPKPIQYKHHNNFLYTPCTKFWCGPLEFTNMYSDNTDTRTTDTSFRCVKILKQKCNLKSNVKMEYHTKCQRQWTTKQNIVKICDIQTANGLTFYHMSKVG